jgi:hypothetical protein
VEGLSFSGTVATFTDTDPNDSAANITATIGWGDASTSPGTVTQTGPGHFTVSGGHTYGASGRYTITVIITDPAGNTATVSTQLIVYLFASGGSFVIGDKNSALGTAVVFWGQDWAKNNALSGGSAPSSFEGFEDDANAPACGAGWTTRPGNSNPPDGPLPSFLGVIVSSSITQSGSTLSGNTLHLVIVATKPGYAPDPGHPGTGTVVAQVC